MVTCTLGVMAIVSLDQNQRDVLAAVTDGRNHRVFGAPGTGKSTLIRELVAGIIESRGQAAARVITPSRQSATAMRDELTLRAGVATEGPLARSISSLAFAIVSEANGDGFPPRLLSGGEQDAILKDILDGQRETGVDAGWPDDIDINVRSIREFRTQVRDLLSRSRDLGLFGGDDRPLAKLAQLGESAGRPEWVAAASLLDDYIEYLEVSCPGQVDPAELINNATAILAKESARPIDEQVTLVLDDAQDFTPSHWRFIAAWSRSRGPIVAFGDPDTATAGFRGTDPGVLTASPDSDTAVTWEPPLSLSTLHRQGGVMPDAIATVRAIIGLADGYTRPAADPSPAAPTTVVRTSLASSPSRERDTIARFLRSEHSPEKPFDAMAVIVRSGAEAESLVSHLNAMNIPAFAETTGRPLRDHPVVASLLLLVARGLHPENLTIDDVRTLLTGPIGGLSSLEYRAVRRTVRAAELASGSNLSADAILVRMMTDRNEVVVFNRPLPRGFTTVSRILHDVGAARESQMDELLWTVWNATGLADRWVSESTKTGYAATYAHDGLDAVLALFHVIETALSNSPTESADTFIERMMGQAVPNDSLSPRMTVGSVVVATPAAVVGREFAVTVVAGLNRGVWPNLRNRSAILHNTELASAAFVSSEERDQQQLDPRRAVLHDEVRLFLLAITRATDSMLLTALKTEDEAPSPLFRIFAGSKTRIEDASLDVAAANALVPTFVGANYVTTLRELVATLRAKLISSESTDSEKADAAAALAKLVKEGVGGAAPSEWLGMRDITGEHRPLFPDGAVSVSPSGLDNFDASALDWFVESVASGASTISMSMGTLIHWVAEKATVFDINTLKTLVDTRWSELSFEAPWVNEAQRAIADTLVTGLSDYLTRSEQGGLEEVLHEQRLRITISDGGADGVTATIGGRIDRIERHADGTATIVDFKTGAKAKSDADTQENLQLRAYQYGLVNGGVVRRVDSDGITVPFHAENAGAKLVFPAVPSTPKGGSPLEYTENVQAVSDDTAHAEFAAAIMEAARGMHQSVFTGPRVGRDFAGSLDPNKVWVRIPEVSAHE